MTELIKTRLLSINILQTVVKVLERLQCGKKNLKGQPHLNIDLKSSISKR